MLKEIDPDAAHAIKVRFAEERAEIAYAKQLAVNSSLRDAEIQQGNEIANNVVNLSGTVNTMGIDNTDSNSPDAKLLRIVKDKLTESSIESIANAGNSDSTLKQAFNLALGVVFKEAADNIPEHISLGDVTTASSGLVGREAKAGIEKAINGTEDVVKNSESIITKEEIVRKSLGGDGATSKHIIEKENGTTISKTHQVEKDGEIIHQQQDYVGKYGTVKSFPDEWVEYPKIDKKDER